LNLNRIIYIK